MGRFVDIRIDAGRLDRSQVEAVVRACPVDIFRLDGDDDALTTHPDREDECILCGRCVAVSAAVLVRRAYGARRPVAAPGADDG